MGRKKFVLTKNNELMSEEAFSRKSQSTGWVCDHIYGYLVFMKHELSLIDALTDVDPEMDVATWFKFCPKCGRKLNKPNR